MGMFDSIFGEKEDPQAAANQYLKQIPGVGQKYYNPFISSGRKAGGILEGEYGKLMNPTSFIDEIMKHYNESEGSKYERNELGRDIGATAAAGGFAGTPEHQKEYGDMAQKLMSRDMQTFLQNALGVYNTGLSGEHDIYGKGYEASGSLADMLAGNLGSQAGLAFQNASQNNANRYGLMNAVAKALATGAGAYFGGVPGAKVGSSLFS
jgi:hypothetical protein